ncbi:MAG: nickel-responsive transcriptional regulator NikR, partial [Caldisericia bacterium]|nr:nickel-responsive transcriptional regulator NikR [Caldisericia bacterium]
MGEIVRFGVSLEKDLLKKFDEYIKEENYPTSSKAISDL